MVQHMIKLLEDDNVLPEVIPKEVWLEISSVEDLPIEFIDKFDRYVHWARLLKCRKFTLEEILDHIDWIRYHPYELSMYQTIETEEALMSLHYYVDWSMISEFQDLDCSAILKFKHNLHWKYVNQSIMCGFTKLMLSDESLADDLPYEFWHNYSLSRYAGNTEFLRKFKDKLNWVNVTRSHNIIDFDDDYFNFFDEFIDYIDWDFISIYRPMSMFFINRFTDRLNWTNVSCYQTISEEIMEKFHDKLDWKMASLKQVMSEEFIEKHADDVDWENICHGQHLSREFIMKHKDRFKYSTLVSKYAFMQEVHT